MTHDPLLGDAHVIVAARSLTAMSAIDWARPTADPGDRRSPRGCPPAPAARSSTDRRALLARAPASTALRYAGPYPTPAL